jgi:hypothetical protein
MTAASLPFRARARGGSHGKVSVMSWSTYGELLAFAIVLGLAAEHA